MNAVKLRKGTKCGCGNIAKAGHDRCGRCERDGGPPLSRRKNKMQQRKDRLADRYNHPTKEPGQVFVTGSRTTYHDHWCNAMNGVWLSGADTIRIVDKVVALAAETVPCSLCQQISGDEHGPKSDY